MGFGLPAALGAAKAFKDSNRVVINFTGDGSIFNEYSRTYDLC